MGNKQVKPTPTPMLKVESKALSCFDEKERPRKGIPRRIGNILLARWIELKRRERLLVEKARKAVSNGRAPPSILEELDEKLKDESQTHRVKYHPRLLANILVKKPRPRPARPGLKVPKLTNTAARRIHQSFMRRDLERKMQEQERIEREKLENSRTKSRISLRQQAWTDTMPRKRPGTTRSTQTFSKPLPLSRDISLRSFRTGESGIGMSRTSSMTSIASSRPRVIYSRERGGNLNEERLQGDGHSEHTDEQEESRRERILEQRRLIRKQRQEGQDDHHRGLGTAQKERRQRKTTSNESESNTGTRVRNQEGPPKKSLHRRRLSSQHHPLDDSQSDGHDEDGSFDRVQGSLRGHRETPRKRAKKISAHEYWRRRALLKRAHNRKESENTTAKLHTSKGSTNKQEVAMPSSSNNKRNERKGVQERRDKSKTQESHSTRETALSTARSETHDADKREEGIPSNNRPPYSFSRSSRRFDEVAEEFLQQNGRQSHNSQRSERKSLKKISKSGQKKLTENKIQKHSCVVEVHDEQNQHNIHNQQSVGRSSLRKQAVATNNSSSQTDAGPSKESDGSLQDSGTQTLDTTSVEQSFINEDRQQEQTVHSNTIPSNDKYEHEERHMNSKESNAHAHSRDYLPDPPANQRVSLVRNDQPLQLARVVPIVEHGRMVEQQGSRSAPEHHVPESRPTAPRSQSRGDSHSVKDYGSMRVERTLKHIPAEYVHSEPNQRHGGTVDYRNVYVDRGPALVYQGRLLEPVRRGSVEMRDGGGSRRWRKVSVVDVWELGEWERLRRTEEALVRSRSSAMTVPRAL